MMRSEFQEMFHKCQHINLNHAEFLLANTARAYYREHRLSPTTFFIYSSLYQCLVLHS